jgi:hypothetical protein
MTFEKQFRPGEELHLQAANLLESIYHNVAVERRASGKKVDIIFHQPHLGRDVRVLVEVKDYSHKLERSEISHIWHDYSGVVQNSGTPSTLLLVTRLGLATGADDFLRTQPLIRHLTIWQLEDLTLSLRPYVEELARAFERSGLSAYYVEARARPATYPNNNLRQLGEPLSLFDEVEAWIEGDEDQPLAILGGYGSGKSSFSKRLAAHLAKRFLADPRARRPVLIPLGVFTGQTQLEGILGAMFTSDHEISNFSVRRFLEHNRRGRLVVILDGFDEMKHAMTFADFRGQLLELVKLIEPGARVLLLGRPSAFLSGDEHAYVLRGRRLFEGSWGRVAQWPEFREYELEPFSREERASFLENYLEYQSRRPGAQLATDQVKGRVTAAEGVAARDPEVFGKPVHNQLLADLASDPDVSLGRLNEVDSKWALYELFFNTLATNEVNKPARRPIPDDARLRFLREVAHWLWAERSGVTHFPASELPSPLLAALPDGHATDEQGKRREYLSGSFLEAKAGGEVFYFPHRSFAEFLVAQWVMANPPGSTGHGGVSRLIRDGVAGFLKEEANRPTLREWAASVGASRDPVSLEYLDTLASAFDTREQFSEVISPRGVRRTLLGKSAVMTFFPTLSTTPATCGLPMSAADLVWLERPEWVESGRSVASWK